MRGYFSQLARSTGIRIAPARTHAVASPRAKGKATPPHVEEVTFVEQPPVPRNANGGAAEVKTPSDRTRRESDAGRVRPELQRSAESASRDASALSADAAASQRDAELPRGESQVDSPALRSHEAVDEHVQAPGAAGTLRTSARATDESPTPESVRRTPAARLEQTRAAEIREGSRPESEEGIMARPDAPGGRERVSKEVIWPEAQESARRVEETDAWDERESAEPAATIDDERAARAELVRRYLHEVRAWVAASPEPEPESEDVLPEWTGEAEEPSPRRRGSRAAEASVSLEPPPARGPEVQDVSLSIGSISIVVEGPQQQVPVTPPQAPQPQAPAGAHEAPAAPVDLSRYYIRRF